VIINKFDARSTICYLSNRQTACFLLYSRIAAYSRAVSSRRTCDKHGFISQRVCRYLSVATLNCYALVVERQQPASSSATSLIRSLTASVVWTLLHAPTPLRHTRMMITEHRRRRPSPTSSNCRCRPDRRRPDQTPNGLIIDSFSDNVYSRCSTACRVTRHSSTSQLSRNVTE